LTADPTLVTVESHWKLLTGNIAVKHQDRQKHMGQTSLLARALKCCDQSALPPRARIIAAARELFHKHGLRSIGVETIAEAAGSNKMTLYRHFGSKDDLILACLEEVATEIEMTWQRLAAEHPDDLLAQLRGWVREGTRCVLEEDRGCALANAAVELAEADHPARKLVENFKAMYRRRLTALCGEAGIAEPEVLADALILLFEGARVSRQSAGSDGPCIHFLRASEAMIDAFATRLDTNPVTARQTASA
jgi:AcrR family transcriptional regulator